MSRIVSPLPPLNIAINFDEMTGATGMQCSKFVEFQTVAQVFATLMIQVIEERLKQKPLMLDASQPLPFEIAMLSLSKLMLSVIQGKILSDQMAKDGNNPFAKSQGNPAGKPGEKPAGNSGNAQ